MKLYAEATTFDEEALDNEFNKKRQNFTSQPVPPYSIGDLWTQGGSGDIMVCRVSKSTGEFAASDWEKASKYTDDHALSEWLNGDYADDIEAIQGQIDAKAQTWYQSQRPDITESWTADEKQKHVGDLWYNTTANTTWRFNGTTWEQQNVPTEIFDAIDGKASIFTGANQPSTASEGDLWFKSASDPIKTYVNGSWVEYNKYTDDSALDAFKEGDYADDIESLQSGISEAAAKVNNYISEIDEDGIFVHEEGQSASPSTGTGVHISDNVSIVKDGVPRTVVDSDGLKVKDENGDDIASFGQDVSLGPSRHPTFRIINSTHMLITEKTQSLNRVAPVNGSTSFSMVLDFDVTTIINVIVDITELKKELGAELVNQTMYLSIDGSQNSYSGAHTVSCSRNGQTVTVTMTNTNRNYKGILRFYEVLYRSNNDLSRMLFGAKPIDSSEYALSIGNGRNTVVTPDWAYESNALGVDWSGNFRDQMSFASLYTNNEQVGTSDANLECKVGNVFGSVFALKEYEWISNEPDAGVTYEIIVKRSGYYHVMLQYTWSSVGNTTSRKRLGPSLNGAYAGFPAFGRDNAWETRSTRSLIYITSGSIIGIRGRSESATSTLYEAQLIIEPAWFL